MVRRVLVAVAQMTSSIKLEKNFSAVSDIVQRAAGAGCTFIAFPEAFAFMGDKDVKSVDICEPLSGNLLGQYLNLAKQHSVWLSLGGFPEKSAVESKVYNTHVIVDSEGNIVDYYRKLHLFDVDIPNGPRLLESSYTVAGDRLVTVDSPIGVLGLTTCYDMRFPGLFSTLRRKGAEIFLVPSAFTVKTGFAHWETLLRARAIENQCFVLAGAQIGKHNEKRESYGYSVIIDPWGAILAQTSPKATTPTFAIAELDLECLDSIRQSMPISKHERPELYSHL